MIFNWGTLATLYLGWARRYSPLLLFFFKDIHAFAAEERLRLQVSLPIVGEFSPSLVSQLTIKLIPLSCWCRHQQGALNFQLKGKVKAARTE